MIRIKIYIKGKKLKLIIRFWDTESAGDENVRGIFKKNFSPTEKFFGCWLKEIESSILKIFSQA